MVKEIKLTKGYVAIVDDDDYDELSKYNWVANKPNKTCVYARRNSKDGNHYMHRIITDCPKGMEVDHINGDKLDNRKLNLRICTHSNNGKNMKPWSKGTSSIYKGVCWENFTSRWKAEITIDRKHITLGRFSNEADAALAYNAAAIKYHGGFARLNIL